MSARSAFQPPVHPSEAQRHEQAAAVRRFADSLLARAPRADLVVLGDINDFEFSETAKILVGGGSLVDLPRTLPGDERYTYVFEGNSQVLDHILISRALAGPARRGAAYDYDVVHTTANSPTRPPTTTRRSCACAQGADAIAARGRGGHGGQDP